MHNYALLKAIGRTGRPALLKRGMAATLDEWLQAGEYLLAGGAAARRLLRARHPQLRRLATRNLLDVGAVAELPANLPETP